MAPPTRREHEYPEKHPRLPVYFPDVTLGNLLAIAVFLATGAGVYAASEARIAKLETKVDMQDAAQKAALDAQGKLTEQAVGNVDHRLTSLEEKIDRILTNVERRR